jgi:Protein of unknown function (DUF2889)
VTDLASPAASTELPPNLDDSVVGTPARAPSSVRRTSTIDMVWPDGFGTPMHLVGRSRDLYTPTDGEPVVLDTAEMEATIGNERTITAIEVVPEREGIERLVGTRGGSRLRSAIDDVLPGEREAATPLHLLLDDIAGASLIGGFAWSRWRDDIRAAMSGRAAMQARAAQSSAEGTEPVAPREPLGIRNGRIICSGLRPGGFAQQQRDLGEGSHAVRPAGDISTPDDPWGWHEWPEHPPVCLRRHRRIDVRRAGDALVVDAFFRDSVWEPDGSELALHEYTVAAEIDTGTHTLRSVEATPRVLPFPECQWAAPYVDLLTGLPVERFRARVQDTLTELQCCTHLNDMLRCLAEVPRLAQVLADD